VPIRTRRRWTKTALLLLSGLALLVLAAACGGEEAPVPTPTLTQNPTPVPTPTRTTAPTPEPEKGRTAINYDSPPPMTIDQNKSYVATMETNKGTIAFELFADEAPMTVNNFVFLAREGYYSGVIFHRVLQNFMVQSGDPMGTGTGGPGYKFNDEPVTRDYLPGTLAMANAGPNTNGSQFFIVQGQTANLPPAYTIFGIVTDGLDVVDAIAATPVGASGSGERSKPLEELVINSVVIEENP